MQVSADPSIHFHFGDLGDPRVDRTRRHPLLSVVTIAICGIICGADSWVKVKEFGEEHREWLSSWLDLPYGIPSHDTFCRVFAHLNSGPFEAYFAGWTESVAALTGDRIRALDMNMSRNLRDRLDRKGALGSIGIWAYANRSSLDRVSVDESSNQIPPVPHQLRLLMLKGCIVPIAVEET